jgi:hypothetical protein
MFSLFQAKPQLQIFEEILGFENYKPTWIATEDDIIFVQLEAKNTGSSGIPVVPTRYGGIQVRPTLL